jgi:hypothetical protein
MTSCYSMPFKLLLGGEQVVNVIKQIAGFNCVLLAFLIGGILGAWKPKQAHSK